MGWSPVPKNVAVHCNPVPDIVAVCIMLYYWKVSSICHGQGGIVKPNWQVEMVLRLLDVGFRHGPFTIWSSTSQFCLSQGRRSGLDG